MPSFSRPLGREEEKPMAKKPAKIKKGVKKGSKKGKGC